MSQAKRKTYKRFISGAPLSRTTKKRHEIMKQNAENLPIAENVVRSALQSSSACNLSDSESLDCMEENSMDDISDGRGVPSQNKEDLENKCDTEDSTPYEKDYLGQPVLPFLTMTKFEALLGVMHFSVANSLSGVAITKLIELINTILGEKDAVPASKYKFDKIFSNNLSYDVNYFCSKCYVYIGKKDDCGSVTRCHHCEEIFSFKNMNDKNYFISIPLQPQLKQILEEEGVAEMLTYPYNRSGSDDCIRDVFDGTTYKMLQRDGIVGPNIDSVTLTFSCDGASVFKSSKGSLWPIQFRINELPPKEKFLPHRLMVAGFWFAQHEPVPATFLKPFLSEINNFSLEPVQWTEPCTGRKRSTKVYLTFGIFDVPAKCVFQNFVQFNGYSGCSYCYHKGTLNNNQVRYNYLVCPLRTDEEVHKDMYEADKKKERINGVKGLSVMLLHRNFDLVYGYSIDYMHQSLLGVTKYVSTSWIDTSNHCETFYISKKLVNIIDKRLLKIQPPSNISRAPRLFSECQMYKANEWRSWLLFFSVPCLHGVLDEKYLKHFALFVSGIYLLLKDSISEEDLVSSEIFLLKFVRQFEELYSLSSMTFNVHLVTHLVTFVRRNGPLWAHSMFPFESGIGFLLKFINGKTNVISQVAAKYCNIYHIPKTIAVYEAKNPQILDYCDSLFSYARLQKTKAFSSATLLGSQKPFAVTHEHIETFRHAGLPPPYNCISGQKVIFNGMVLAVDKEGTLRNDSIVKVCNGKYYRILNFVYYPSNDLQLYFLCKEIFIVKKKFPFYVPHIKLCKPYYGTLSVLPIQEIICKSILMKVAKLETGTKILKPECDLFVADFPNFFERD